MLFGTLTQPIVILSSCEEVRVSDKKEARGHAFRLLRIEVVCYVFLVDLLDEQKSQSLVFRHRQYTAPYRPPSHMKSHAVARGSKESLSESIAQ